MQVELVAVTQRLELGEGGTREFTQVVELKLPSGEVAALRVVEPESISPLLSALGESSAESEAERPDFGGEADEPIPFRLSDPPSGVARHPDRLIDPPEANIGEIDDALEMPV